MNNTISVVIPVHNKAEHVGRAIRSVLQQIHQVEEIILIDDASTDASLQAMESFNDPRIRILRRERPGPGGYAARNLGVMTATSEWVAFLDADDEWYPNHLSEMARLAQASGPETVCLFTGWEWAWPNGKRRRDAYSHRVAADSTLDFRQVVQAWLKDDNCPIWTSACAFRREAIIAAGLFPAERCRRGGDKDTWLRTVATGLARSSHQVTVAYHQDDENQVIRTTGTNKRHCLCETIETIIPGLSAEDQVLLKTLYNREIYAYARQVGLKERLKSELISGFHVSVSPGLYAVLLALRVIPGPVQRVFRRLAGR